ncbi:MAG TPA: hypothetical protein VF532_24680 [Candidatus Angelobacter sp.]
MRFFRTCLPAIALIVLAGCEGFSLFVGVNNGRLLVAVSVNPTVIDPIQFPNGQVQFTASGNFNMAPMIENPMTNVMWTVDRPAFGTAPDPGHATISQTGLAQCAVGFIGTVQVFATSAANPSQPLSQSNQVVGTARMNCP